MLQYEEFNDLIEELNSQISKITGVKESAIVDGPGKEAKVEEDDGGMVQFVAIASATALVVGALGYAIFKILKH